MRVAVAGGGRWRTQVVAAALTARGVTTRGPEDADVLVVLGGAPTHDVATCVRSAGRGSPVLYEPAGVHARLGTRARPLPDPCTPDRLVALLRRPHAMPRQVRRGVGAPAQVAPLSGREQQVLVGLSEGSSNAEIADDLGLSRHTVRTHVQNLLAKLDVPNRASAVAAGHRMALLQ